MTLEQAVQWRNVIGKATAYLCMVLAIAMLDGVIAQFREPVNVFHLLPGTSESINGHLQEQLAAIEELTCTSSSDSIQVTFESLHSGFWLGGYMWRGKLTVSPQAVPGKYSVVIRPRGKPEQKSDLTFRVNVYADEASHRQSFKSIIRRTADFSPWWVVAVLLPIVGVAFGSVFLLSQKIDGLMAQSGKAEVYLVRPEEFGQEIAFGLGTRHGVQVGSRVTILNETGQPVCTAEIQQVSATDAVARAGSECDVKPGYVAMRA
jgi:hypothetical protein